MKPIAPIAICVVLVVMCGCGPPGPAGPPVPGGEILAEGTRTLAAGERVTVLLGTIKRPGKLTGEITWAGPPAKLKAFFRRGCPMKRGSVSGGSPLVPTVRITGRDMGTGSWRLCVVNPGAASATLGYVVRFRRR